MKKDEILLDLMEKLSFLPFEEMKERIDFYSEMIDDRIEEGVSEEETVSEIGNIDDIVSQIIADTPLTTLVKEKIRPKKKLNAWEIVLLALGSPIWLSLAIAAVAVIFSLYIVLWAVGIALWSADASLVGGFLGGIVSGIIFVCRGNGLTGVAMVGAGLFCAGCAVFFAFACKGVTKGIFLLSKKIALGIKSLFVRKETVL